MVQNRVPLFAGEIGQWKAYHVGFIVNKECTIAAPKSRQLVDACRDGTRTVLTRHVNSVLVQPHWRSHEELIKLQVV